MYKFSVCLMIVIIFTVASPAQNNDLLPKSIHIESSNGTEEYELTYDNDGRLLNEDYEVYTINENLEKVFTSKRYLSCTYNSDGWIESESWDIYAVYSGMEITDVYRMFYEYNELGNVTEIYKENYSDSTWSPYSRELFTYYNDSLVKEELNQSYKNEEWQNTIRYSYEYDASGNRLSELWENWEDGSWINYYLYTYTYNDNGESLLNLTQKWEDDHWINMGRYQYTYGTNSVIYTNESWEADNWLVNNRYSYQYDTIGNLLSYTKESLAEDVLTNNLRSKYTYDSLGNMIMETFEFWEDDAWDLRSRHVYSYNEKSCLISDYFQTPFDGVWCDNIRCLYEYDYYGNLIDGKSELYSGSLDKWVSFEYFHNTDIGVQLYNTLFFNINVEYIDPNSVNNEIGRFNFCINNYPNPFTSTTTIEYSVKAAGNCNIEIFNAQGGLVRQFNEYNPSAGDYNIYWDGRDDASNELPAGIYYVNIHANGQSGQFPVVLVR